MNHNEVRLKLPREHEGICPVKLNWNNLKKHSKTVTSKLFIKPQTARQNKQIPKAKQQEDLKVALCRAICD